MCVVIQYVCVFKIVKLHTCFEENLLKKSVYLHLPLFNNDYQSHQTLFKTHFYIVLCTTAILIVMIVQFFCNGQMFLKYTNVFRVSGAVNGSAKKKVM